jgi:hypothetical protein
VEVAVNGKCDDQPSWKHNALSLPPGAQPPAWWYWELPAWLLPGRDLWRVYLAAYVGSGIILVAAASVPAAVRFGLQAAAILPAGMGLAVAAIGWHRQAAGWGREVLTAGLSAVVFGLGVTTVAAATGGPRLTAALGWLSVFLGVATVGHGILLGRREAAIARARAEARWAKGRWAVGPENN